MKTCTTCQLQKQVSEFGTRKASHDGLTASCLECLRVRDRARYPKERKRRRDWQLAYLQTFAGKKASEKAKRDWQARNAEKRAAHVILGNAVRDGRVVKSPCEVCGKKKVHGHHDDYGKPLEVRWLCQKHHVALHKEK